MQNEGNIYPLEFLMFILTTEAADSYMVKIKNPNLSTDFGKHHSAASSLWIEKLGAARISTDARFHKRDEAAKSPEHLNRSRRRNTIPMNHCRILRRASSKFQGMLQWIAQKQHIIEELGPSLYLKLRAMQCPVS